MCTEFMGCEWWGRIVGQCKGLFVSLVNTQVNIYYKEENTRYRNIYGIIEHKGCKDKCGWS